MLFTQPFLVEIYFSTNLEGKGTVTAVFSMEISLSSELNGSGDLVADFIRELFIAANLDGIGTMDINMIRERLMAVAVNGEGSLQGNLSRFHVDSISVVGSFAPGDKIVIDSGKLRATKNGQPIGYSGDFFDLHPGQNTITYTDPDNGRTIQIRITHRDKYLY
jgi:hypothetical protein